MRKIIFLFLVISFMQGCAKKLTDVKVIYDDDTQSYKTIVKNTFDNCKDVGYKVFEKENKIKEFWIKGGGKEVSFIIDERDLPKGDFTVRFFCDDKYYDNLLSLKNSKFPLVNLFLYNEQGFKEKYINYLHLISSKELYSELKEITLKDTHKVDLLGLVYNFFPDNYKADLMKSFVDYGYEKNLTNFVVANLSSIVHNKIFDDVFLGLLKLNVKWVDIACLDYLSNFPTKENFDKYFGIISQKEHLANPYKDFIDFRLQTPFAKESFKFLEEKIKSDDVKGGFLLGIYNKYVLLSDNALNLVVDLIKSKDKKKINWAIRILNDRYSFNTSGTNEFNVPLSNEILLSTLKETWNQLSNNEKRFFIKLYGEIFVKDIDFYERLTKDKELWDIVLPLGEKIEFEKATEGLKDFYLKLLEDKINYHYAVFFFKNTKREFKVPGLKRYYELYRDFAVVELLYGLDNDFYEKEHLKIVTKENKGDISASIDALLNFDGKYCSLFYELFNKERDLDIKMKYLIGYAKCDKKDGVKYAYEFIKNDINNTKYAEVLDCVLVYGEEILIEDILRNFESLTLSNKIKLMQKFVGRPMAKFCPYMDKFFSLYDLDDLKIEIMWAYAYSCPIEFFDWIKGKEEINERFLREVVDAFRDIFVYMDNKYTLNDKIRDYLYSFYERYKDEYVIDIFSVIFKNVGERKDIPFFRRMIDDAKNNKPLIIDRYEEFLERLEKGS